MSEKKKKYEGLSLHERIHGAAGDLPTFVKDQRNKFANYDFVGVDQVLEKVRAVLIEWGISWEQLRLGMHRYEQGDQLMTDMQITWQFGLVEGGGDKITMDDYQPISRNDSQARGGARSYSLKFCLRDLMCASSGEDSDHDKPADKPPAPKAKPAPKYKNDTKELRDECNALTEEMKLSAAVKKNTFVNASMDFQLWRDSLVALKAEEEKEVK
jgi:hypothetical protein